MWDLITLLHTNESKDKMLGRYLANQYEKKVSLVRELNLEMEKGINIYSRIDKTLRQNENVNACIKRLSPLQRRYGYKIISIFFDHFLVKNWKLYSKENFNTFIASFHLYVLEKHDLFPYKSRKRLPIFIRKNIYQNAESIHGLNLYFQTLIKHEYCPAHLANSLGDLVNKYDEFHTDFTIVMNSIREELSIECNYLQPEFEKVS